MQKPTLGFIGAGKVGHTLARLLSARGYTVAAIYSHTQSNALSLAQRLGSEVVDSPGAVVQVADLTLLTVSDDAIASVAASISGELGAETIPMKAVIHTSGALEMGVLSALANQGIMIGSFHPVFPFADVETAIAGLPGAVFGVQATQGELLREWLDGIVVSLNGRILAIPPGGKAVYHAAFVFASNYTVTLYSIAERLLLSLGTERDTADHALSTLLAGTLENLRHQGIPAALTGPLVRGDVRTIQAHLDVLSQIDQDVEALYRQLAQLSLPMLAARDVNTFFVEQLLNRETDYASDDS
jgi:predicted short-subunit dehydrogenase-like oxidoreductase (DUF2520 family)